MDIPWFRKRFRRAPAPDVEGTRARAQAGDAEAQFAMGVLCSRTDGGSPDFAQAAHWFELAADQNHPLAQLRLGMLYATGQGVAEDDSAALRWLRRAADQGVAEAQHNLGLKYNRAGIGRRQLDTPGSRIEAYKWFRLAAAQGYKDSVAAWELMTLGMTREEVAEGNRRAASFSVKPAG